MASNLKAMAFNLPLVTFVLLVRTTLGVGLQLRCDGLQPKSDGL